MLAVFGGKRALSGLCAGIFCAALCAGAAQAEVFDVKLDQARVMKLPDKVATIVIGNPLIADAALQAGGLLVITGKGYGATNMLVLDRAGRVIVDTTLQVHGAKGADLVTVYKGIERETLSCSPQCAARITLGDSNSYFGSAMGQSVARTGSASAAGPAAAAAR